MEELLKLMDYLIPQAQTLKQNAFSCLLSVLLNFSSQPIYSSLIDQLMNPIFLNISPRIHQSSDVASRSLYIKFLSNVCLLFRHSSSAAASAACLHLPECSLLHELVTCVFYEDVLFHHRLLLFALIVYLLTHPHQTQARQFGILTAIEPLLGNKVEEAGTAAQLLMTMLEG